MESETKPKRQMHPNSIANLKKFQKGVAPNPKGRPPKFSTQLKKMPRGFQEKVYAMLAKCIQAPDIATAKRYLLAQEGELGEYGIILQLAAKQMTADGGWGWSALNDILDRLIGKPKQTSEMEVKGDGVTIVVRDQEEAEKIKDFGNLGV